MKKIEYTSQELLLKEIVLLLTKEKIPYMITGSMGVIFYGRPRASHDIDFIVDPNLIENAVRRVHQFNVLHLPTMLKLDFWLLKNEPFDQERFSRKRPFHVFGQIMNFASPEDTILIKLLWYMDSKIEKHLIDAAFVYQVQKEELDNHYLAFWSEKQGTKKLLQKLGSIDLEQYY